LPSGRGNEFSLAAIAARSSRFDWKLDLSRKMTHEDPVPVWPFEQDPMRGYAFLPLYKKAPQAALKNPELFQLLALVDAMGARESANWPNVAPPQKQWACRGSCLPFPEEKRLIP
jgi:hypothetical protein